MQVQGCLALITSGRGGHLNLLLGSAEEGRDVFVYTGSQLIPSDTDTAGDIYDARIDGGSASTAGGPGGMRRRLVRGTVHTARRDHAVELDIPRRGQSPEPPRARRQPRQRRHRRKRRRRRSERSRRRGS